MKVKIISDSTCDLSEELLKKYDIAIAPLSVTLGDNTYKDGVEMNVEDIYAYVEKTGSLPTTNAVNLADYIDIFREWKDKGYDGIVHFNISADFSSSYQNACLAAEEFDNVCVVDSRNLSTGQGLVVLRGAELAMEGKTPQEIQEACNAMTPKVEASFVIDKLDYLYKGGRCSAVAALGANLLKLKPCIEVTDGKMDAGKKYRGKWEKVILDYVKDRLEGRDDIDKKRIFITHTRCLDEVVKSVEAEIKSFIPDFEEILITTAGATITTHCGPNTLGVLFVRK